MNGIDRQTIRAAEGAVRAYIRETPVVRASGSDFGLGPSPLVFKLELLQHGGSFKARGAFANLLLRDVPKAGVVAASGGNHGVAVSLAAKHLGHPAKIFLPTLSSAAKVARIRGNGADLVFAGERIADAFAASEQWSRETGALQVHPFDQVETMLGQGTLGLELDRQAPEIDTLLVPVGGAGLIAGIAAAYEERIAAGTIRIIGVEPESAPTLTHALRAGGPVDAPVGGIAADSLAPPIVGQLVYPIVKELVSEVILVPDEAIREAQEAMWATLRVVPEPGGAAALSALLSKRFVPAPGETIGLVVSGGNTTAVHFAG